MKEIYHTCSAWRSMMEVVRARGRRLRHRRRTAADRGQQTVPVESHLRSVGGVVGIRADPLALRSFHREVLFLDGPASLSRVAQGEDQDRGRGPPSLLHPGDLPETESRSEEHTSELQSLAYLVCRLLLEKKK